MEKPAVEHVKQLRALLKENRLDAYVVPSADPHQTEYVHPHWRCRAWLSGFTGSAGTAVVMAEKAGVWADGRYFIQAERELEGSGFELFKMKMDGVPELIDWLAENVPQGGAVGVDGRLITAKQGKEWAEKLEKKKARLVTDVDLVSQVWIDRPELPTDPAKRWPVEYAGRSAADKLKEIRAAMEEQDADTYLISSIYDVNWLFNIRGNDTAHTPLLTSYALVEKDKATLFAEEAKLTQEVREGLAAEGIGVAPYDGIFEAVEELPESAAVFLCEERVSAALRRRIPCKVVEGKELASLPKARKNETELHNWERVHELDGVAMVRYWKWLEENVPNGGVDEVDASDELERLRLANPECLDLSFTSISGYGPNAAMMHYCAKRGDCATLEPKGFYLIDSGGQYLGGTTDITRTFALGELTDEQRMDYTLVLKGVINLSSTRFLKGTAGNNLDVLARLAMWEHGVDYKCGTGHGVGCYLNVHEGPQGISAHKTCDTPFEPGMLLTIEPGVYKEDRHGIRIENMAVVEEDCETECGIFYRFRTQTLCPVDTAPLKAELMTEKELKWLNAFHQKVFDRLAPHLSAEERAWLENKTRPFPAEVGHKG
ncbi:putative dipeptidase PepE [Pontiella desulfatans]|uniref:Putative dipeptidase PepE n=2 Tax=Pontiella desulfatans TaxID=2750659 RepID=A0A6C2TVY1_PONDE|nr:putative dipeptidase PepE [Pontiella desulfatans]